MAEKQTLGYTIKKCPSCGHSFKCYHENILQCDCSKIKLDEKTLLLIKQKYKTCLCPTCLKNFLQ
ncbi:MAG: cysteine-rich CWC family protein [Bacteroidales bacterium]|nr:cysteine-rich CWC family protein [Bacteroidales bacterium]